MRALLDLLVPSLCDGCGAAAAPPWCEQCDQEHRAAAPLDPCARCAGPGRSGHACWRGAVPVGRLLTLGPWTGGVARAAVRAKLVGRREVMRAAGERLGDAVAAAGLKPSVVVAVPTDRGRARARGADHTAALARGAAAALSLPVVRPFAAVRGSVDRVGVGGVSAGTAGTPRVVLRTVATGAVVGVTVLVVDDVVTTGTTLSSVASAVSLAGAERVVAATIGRAGAHALGLDGVPGRPT